MNAVMVVQDRFSVAGQSSLAASAGSHNQRNPFIRRPTRGIQIKEDTFATLRLVSGVNGQNINLIDAGSNRTQDSQPIEIDGKRATDIYSNFLIQKVDEQRMEKAQILETFGEPFIFLFGERARVINFEGILANTFDFNWEAEWWYNYDTYLRGTQAVENDARVFLSYDTTLVSGYIISAAASKVPDQPYLVHFTFQIFLTSYDNFSDIGNPNALPGFPLDLQHSDLDTTDVQQVTNAAAAAQYRPTLIEPTTGVPLTSGLAVVNDALNFSTTRLADAFQSAVALVQNAWSAISNVANSGPTGIAGLISNAVNIPVGFAGALQFDDTANVKLVQAGFGNPIKYSVFSDNVDEYVGAGTQYGSSISQSGVVKVNLPLNTPAQTLQNGQQMVATATKQWEANGFVVPPAALGQVASALSSASGLVAIGAAATGNATPTLGSAAGPFGAGLSAVGLPA